MDAKSAPNSDLDEPIEELERDSCKKSYTYAAAIFVVFLLLGSAIGVYIAQNSHRLAHRVMHEEFSSLRVFSLEFGTIDHHGQQIVQLPELELQSVLGYSVCCFSAGALRLDNGVYKLQQDSFGEAQLEFIVSDPSLFSATCRFMAWMK
jgi:hypothetical protein